MSNEKKIITFEIDGKQVSAPEGTSILEAAKSAGIYIPHYCYHPALSVVGSCRLCLVEVHAKTREGDFKKLPKLQISCQIPVAPDTKVYTSTPEVEDARKGMMEFLLANHPLDCPICDKGGECMLQRYSMDYGIAKGEFEDYKRRYPKLQFDKIIDLERNRCILCTRCVRFCHEIIGRHVFATFERGGHTRISTYKNVSVPTYFSGNVIDLCPVGALTSKTFRFKARNWELLQTSTTCTLCPAGCDVTKWSRDGKVYRTTTPSKKSRGRHLLNEDTDKFICNFARFGNDYGKTEKRITDNYINENNSLTKSDYESALLKAASLIDKVKDKSGADKIGFILSPRLSCEDMFTIQHFGRMTEINNIDILAGTANAGASKAVAAALKISKSFSDFSVYKTAVLINIDLYNQAPVTALNLKEAIKKNGGKIITAGYITDQWLSNFAAEKIVCQPDKVDEKLAALKIIQDVKTAGDKVIIFVNPEECSGLLAVQNVKSALTLKKLIGENADIFISANSANAAGAVSAGALYNTIPGGELSDVSAAAAYENKMKIKLNKTPGLTAAEMIAGAAAGDIKALVVFGADELIKFPDRNKLVKALDKVEALIVCDVVSSFVSEKADVIFAMSDADEYSGTFITNEGKLKSTAKGIKPSLATPAAPAEIALDLMERSFVEKKFKDSSEIFSKIVDFAKPVCPFTKDNNKKACPADCKVKSSDRYRVAEGRYSNITQDFRPGCRVTAQIAGVEEQIEKMTAEPVKISGDEFAATWNLGMNSADHRLSNSEMLAPVQPLATVIVNSADAAKKGIVTGSKIILESNGGKKEFPAEVSDNIVSGMIRITGMSAADINFMIDEKTKSLPKVKLSCIKKSEKE